jgi:threonine/homoserine/homoserine lactone efflux protein
MLSPGPDMAIVTRKTLAGGRAGRIQTSPGVFTMGITTETTPVTILILIALMMSISAVFRLFFVVMLNHPSIRGLPDRSQKAVNRYSGCCSFRAAFGTD